ncbi:ATP-binding protein [Microbacterium sp. 18062]|uniref:ATP-binding protein n=1 Tax=Microbacterium sp. 18062 TaxID=2681410 RepID=UPI00135B05BA|nr:ATP-binding protein [Microbacterium sp. 18062]
MTQRTTSAASRVFLIVLVAVLALGSILAVLLVLDAQRAEREEAEELTRAVASTIAAEPGIAKALGDDDPVAALQPYAVHVMQDAGVDFVTIMTTDGTRVTHRDPAQIGAHYLGTVPTNPETLTEESTGTLGPSVRTIAPIETSDGIVGWVAVGVTLGSIASGILPRLPFVLAIAAAVLAAGVVGAVLARRSTRKVAGDLAPGGIRDALSSHESMRTLGEALRAQTHEHGNRMHTAVTLIELGRTEDAIGILTETSRQSQALVDRVASGRDGDPAIGALLLGKASQAAEKGIAWSAEVASDAPRSPLTPVDGVAVMGNLIDNALDAAAAGGEPRWVRVELAPTPGGDLSIVVSDSGRGVPPALRERVFERGFSTKPAGAEGRGVGLALVRSVVESAGGSIDIDRSQPTTLRVVLPAGGPA